jgi:AraC-like DNA-binding protein
VKRALANPRNAIREIASDEDFRSLSLMSRVLGHLVGETPADHRGAPRRSGGGVSESIPGDLRRTGPSPFLTGHAGRPSSHAHIVTAVQSLRRK